MRVLLVDDSQPIRRSDRALLETHSGFHANTGFVSVHGNGGVPLSMSMSMSSIHPEYLDADPSNRSVAADVLLREEPDEEEDEDNEKDHDETDEEEDGDDGGYSE